MLITLALWPPRRRSNRTGSRTAPQPFLSDSQWLLIADLLADPPPSPLGGRPRVEPRPCLEGIIWILTRGGPDNSTTSLVMVIYREAFIELDLGSAAAISVVLLGVLVVFNAVQLGVLRRRS